MIEFANADGTGAKYCFWVNEKGIELENAPIVVIGSEGHDQIVAKNIKELLQLLSFGPEILDGGFYRDDEYFEDEENSEEFREWMKNELNVNPVKDHLEEESKEVNQIIERALEVFAEPFKNWRASLMPQYGS